VTDRIGAVGVEATTGTGVLLRRGGRLEALPMPLGSEALLGLAGPYGTPLMAEGPAPADPADGANWAKACPGSHRLPSTVSTSANVRDIGSSGSFNKDVSCAFPRASHSASLCHVRLGYLRDTGSRGRPKAVFPLIVRRSVGSTSTAVARRSLAFPVGHIHARQPGRFVHRPTGAIPCVADGCDGPAVRTGCMTFLAMYSPIFSPISVPTRVEER